jgi:branched-chain amino acid transport system ATP-binding protein
MSLLEVKGVRAAYGDFQALFGIDLQVDAGEVIAIIGANGAGKSTLLKSICGVVPVQAPMVCFDGVPIGGRASREVVRRGLALVPEGRRLFPSLTVEENLLMGTTGRRGGAWTLERVYGLFPRLAERRRQRPTSMSGGEQQMVAIGRALLSNPRLLMCDELSLGLAPTVVRDIYATLQRIREEGTALVIVEQDIQQALAVADRVYCLQEGRVSLSGRPPELGREQISAAYFGC